MLSADGGARRTAILPPACRPRRPGPCSGSQRGALCSWAQLLAHNSSFYVPLFLPVSMLVSPKKGSGCNFASRRCVGSVGGGEGLCCENMLFLRRVERFNRLLTVFHTNVSLQRGRHSCWPLTPSTASPQQKSCSGRFLISRFNVSDVPVDFSIVLFVSNST